MTQEKSVLLEDEYICSIFEYASDSLALGCLKTQNLYNVKGLKEVTEIIADNQKNDNKTWIGHFPIPGLEGFLICAG